MPDDKGVLSAFFEDAAAARRAVRELRQAGFSEGAVEVVDEPRSLFNSLLARHEREPRARVTVRSARQLEAAAILQRYGGHDWEDPAREVAGAPPHEDGRHDGQVIELLEEEPYVQTVPVQVGEVVIRKVIETETRTLEVPIRREEIVVERLPAAGRRHVGEASPPTIAAVNAPPESLPTEIGADEELVRLRLLEEEVIVTKQPVIREEVIVRKRRVPEPTTQNVEIRREELRVQKRGDAQVEQKVVEG